MRKLAVVLLVALLATTCLPALGSAQPADDPVAAAGPASPGGRLGIVGAFAAPDLARLAGARWERINFFWDAIQPKAPDAWDWTGAPMSDAQLADDIAAGITPVGLIGNPPAWATRNGSVPKNLDLSINDPQNYWAQFVTALAQRYRGRINYWIIWNEPDIDPGQIGSTWGGREDEYYTLLKTASIAAKAVNPSAKIVFAGTTYFADFNVGRQLFLERVLTVARDLDPTAPANGYYFDAVSTHIYAAVYEMENIPQKYREVLQRFGLNKPIWISESNVVPYNDQASGLPPGHFRVTLDEQASFVIEAFALAMSAGVERFEIYKMTDGTVERQEPYGLVRNDRSLRPAFTAFQVASRYLDQPATSVTHRREGDINYVVFERPGTRTTVVWNSRPSTATATITPAGTRAMLVDKYGVQTTLDPRQNSYSIRLAPATANTVDGQPDTYIIGGNPLILVEDGVGESVSDTGNSLYYPITGYHISGTFLDYFLKRGGLRTFGFPISRRLVLLGSEVQFFQRQVMQVRPDGSISTVNILDSDLMPYTQVNGASLPSIDRAMQTAAPIPGSPAYALQSLQFVRDRVPNTWNGQPVNFLQTFTNTVRAEEAFPGSVTQLNLLPGINLELWGLPTSAPITDPANGNFVFQRFQRGMMHYNRLTGASEGILLAAYLRAIITGRELPTDLATQATSNRFYLQYANDKPLGLNRPDQLPGTNLRDAFEREPYGQLPPLLRP